MSSSGEGRSLIPARLELDPLSLDPAAAAASSGLRTGSPSSPGIATNPLSDWSPAPGATSGEGRVGITGTESVFSGKGFASVCFFVPSGWCCPGLCPPAAGWLWPAPDLRCSCDCAGSQLAAASQPSTSAIVKTTFINLCSRRNAPCVLSLKSAAKVDDVILSERGPERLSVRGW